MEIAADNSIVRGRMSYKFTVVVVRPSLCMKHVFRGSNDEKCFEVALDLATHAIKEAILLGTTRSKVAFVIGDVFLGPWYIEESNLMKHIKMIESEIKTMNFQIGLGLLQQMDMVLQRIVNDMVAKDAKKLSFPGFKRGEYEFRVITCKDGPKSEALEICLTFEDLFKSLYDKVLPYMKIYVLEPLEYIDIKDSCMLDEEIGLLNETNRCSEIIKLHEHLSLLPGPFLKRISHFVRFSGSFEISPDLKIPVKVFSKTSIVNAPSMEKFSKLSNPHNQRIMSGKVSIQKIFYEQGDHEKIVDPKLTLKAYSYGPDFIPIPKEIQTEINDAGKREVKELKLLGFSSGKRWRREYILSKGDVILPASKVDKDIIAYKALLEAMIDVNVMAYCSFAPRNNSKAKLYGLFPFQEEDKSLQLFGAEIPTGEDIREFTFARLKQASDEQLGAIEEFVKANEIPDEVGNPHYLFNPERQIILQNVYDRGISILADVDKPLIRHLPKSMDEVISPPLPKDSPESYLNLGKMFNLQVHEIKKNEKKKKIWWKDAIISKTESLVKTEEIEEKNAEMNMQESMKVKKEDDIQYPKLTTDHISDIRPIQDFREMIEDRRNDKTDRAIKEMKRVISKILENLLPGDHGSKAVDCLKELRKACIDHDEYRAFNDFLQELSKTFKPGLEKYKAYWQTIVRERLSLIGNVVCRLSNVSEDESDNFLNDIERDCVGNQTEASKKPQYIDNFNDIE